MKNAISSLILMAAFTASFAQAAVQTIKAEVNGMVCAFCAQGIDKSMRALPQTGDVYVNLKHKVVALELKEGQTISHQAVKDLVKEAGYDVVRIETVSQSVREIKAALPKE